ncbi:MAG: hypothetical protein HFH76_12220 [Lachnospiraceae bacterium]|jgi:hypothetical protein|nr:hypothetical protein [Lachnospiraceae bacterium]
MNNPNFFGIRHLSPAGAYYLRGFLDERKPRLVLVEGPSDFGDMLSDIVRGETKPPIAVLAYTKEAPVRTVLYPFAEYSPEYQAIQWCHKHQVECRFMDLPSETFLAIPESGMQETEGEEGRMNVYEQLDRKSGGDGHDTFWERVMEQAGSMEAYHLGANSFGANIRSFTEGTENDWAETALREAYMRRQIRKAVDSGVEPQDIVVVTGSYHVEGLKNWRDADEDLSDMPKVGANHTLMPYSYYRLSTRAGYGAGNKAPAYYALLWEGLNRGEPMYAVYSYLIRLAEYQRGKGNPVSSASVIEAVRLAMSLAQLRGGTIASLRDLRDAAETCLGEGSVSNIILATADTEIGTAIGALPDGVSRTSIQEDFYRQLKDLKLEKYRDITAQDLMLDLRENRRVSSEKSAFIDLHRSFFLHRLRVIQVGFAQQQAVSQDNATWSEHWVVRWTPEAEIELVESALRGDTIDGAASFVMKERVENAGNMGDIALVIEDACCCGMEKAVSYATAALQRMAVDAASVEDLAKTAQRLSVVVQYGNIRRIDAKPLEPILQQLFYRACLILEQACVCDDAASKVVITAMEQLNSAELAHDFLDNAEWIKVLDNISERDDLNTKLSGFAAAILLERGSMDTRQLRTEVSRRLSKGIPADLGAGWFEGLAMKNRYALIARLSLWESLNDYLDTLDDEEFKRALVFLRRAFADFSAAEKDQIAENLGEILGLNGQEVSEAVNAVLDESAQEMIEGLDDFDFDL